MSTKTPEPKDVVLLLCKFLREEDKVFRSRSGNQVKKRHSVFLCPSENCRETNREIVFQKGSGYINPLNHLKTCVAGGDLNILHSIYENNIVKKIML